MIPANGHGMYFLGPKEEEAIRAQLEHDRVVVVEGRTGRDLEVREVRDRRENMIVVLWMIDMCLLGRLEAVLHWC